MIRKQSNFIARVLLVLSCTLLQTPSALAQGGDIPRLHTGRPDFNGMWLKEPGSPSSFDQTITRYEDQNPPLNDEYMKLYRDRLAARARGEPSDDPTAACLPAGLVRLYNLILPSEIVQADRMLVWGMEWNNDSIRVYLDGRAWPEDLYPTYNGFSIGTWDGDTLVIETRALRGDTLLDSSGVPHTDQLTVVNRLRYLDANTLESVQTLTDPGAMTAPWTATRKYIRAPADYRILEYICLENNRNPVGADGKIQVLLQGNEE
jgi:hypothetical protein